MRKYLIFLFFVLVACAEQPDLEGIKQSFINKKPVYEELRFMIKEDQRENSCFTLGFKRLGYYRHKYKEFWELAFDFSGESKKFIKVLTFAKVLNFEKITQERYKKYLSLLKEINASDISYCTSLDKTNWTSLTVYSSTKMTRYTSIDINKNDNKFTPKTLDNIEEIPLLDGWYITAWH